MIRALATLALALAIAACVRSVDLTPGLPDAEVGADAAGPGPDASPLDAAEVVPDASPLPDAAGAPDA